LFRSLLKHPEYGDWALTALFYSAVKLVDAYTIERGEGLPEDHDRRRRFVLRWLPPRIWEKYRNLEDASRQTRYHCHRPSAEELQDHYSIEFLDREAQLRNRGIYFRSKA
jgi:hypothetical protein